MQVYLLYNDRMISVCFQDKLYALTSNAEEAVVEQFYEDLQYLLEPTPKKYVLFIIGVWNTGSEEIPGVTGKLALEYKMKQGKG